MLFRSSIGMIIKNGDQRSQDYGDIKDRFRPGHADFTYQQKYGIRDYRGGGRSSARETAMRVAAGAIAKKYLREQFGIEVRGFLSQIGEVKIAVKYLSLLIILSNSVKKKSVSNMVSNLSLIHIYLHLANLTQKATDFNAKLLT